VIWGSGDLVIGKIKKGIGWDDSAKSFRSWDEAMRWMGPLYHRGHRGTLRNPKNR
jgi:hypothetical protein